MKQDFIEEAQLLLVKLDNALIELEKNPSSRPHIDEVFRVMHTIKGTSGMFGFDTIVDITHDMESLYDTVKTLKQPVTPALLEVTFAAADLVKTLLDEVPANEATNELSRTSIKATISHVKRSLETFTPPPSPPFPPYNTPRGGIPPGQNDSPSTWGILFYPDEEITHRAVNLAYIFHDLFALGKYMFCNEPLESESKQYWCFFLITTRPYDDIENALLFIMDYCRVIKVASFDIFDDKELASRNIATNQPLSMYETSDNETGGYNTNPASTSPTRNDAGNVHHHAPANGHLPTTSTHESFKTNNIRSKTSRISVDASKLDILMYLVSELVTSKSELVLALQKQNIEKALVVSEKIEKLSKMFSDNALSIRLVSLHEQLNRFKRLIRDLSKQLGKMVNFVTVGDDTELDKNIIDNIGEPIMHLIRNCIDHGIETPDNRLTRGKTREGTVKFEASKSGNYVYITISDDGNGIDSQLVMAKAVEMGLVTPDAHLTEKEVFDLIFLPGFSTAQHLSNVSGRGVGMDVVLKKIQEIRGDITVASSPGVGTSFTIKLQQSISIIETLLIEAGGNTFAVPIEDIETCVLEDTATLANNRNKLITYNNDLIPYIDLRLQHEAPREIATDESTKIIIIRRLDKVYGIITENIIGEYQAVIKPMGSAFTDQKFISGASLLGDGSIALLLDTDKLWLEISP